MYTDINFDITFLYPQHHPVPRLTKTFSLRSLMLGSLDVDESHFPLPSCHGYCVAAHNMTQSKRKPSELDIRKKMKCEEWVDIERERARNSMWEHCCNLCMERWQKVKRVKGCANRAHWKSINERTEGWRQIANNNNASSVIDRYSNRWNVL